MNQFLSDIIDAEIATLTRVVDAPIGPLGYGRDLSCVQDCDDKFSEVDPNTPTAIGQAILRRLDTPRGSNPDDKDYGLDVRGMLNRGLTLNQLNRIENEVHGEVIKDERVADAQVDVTVLSVASKRMRVSISITPMNPEVSDFKLVFAVTDAQVLLDTIEVVVDV